eukprot:5248339-Prymnesium_polylepis.1
MAHGCVCEGGLQLAVSQSVEEAHQRVEEPIHSRGRWLALGNPTPSRCDRTCIGKEPESIATAQGLPADPIDRVPSSLGLSASGITYE